MNTTNSSVASTDPPAPASVASAAPGSAWPSYEPSCNATAAPSASIPGTSPAPASWSGCPSRRPVPSPRHFPPRPNPTGAQTIGDPPSAPRALPEAEAASGHLPGPDGNQYASIGTSVHVRAQALRRGHEASDQIAGGGSCAAGARGPGGAGRRGFDRLGGVRAATVQRADLLEDRGIPARLDPRWSGRDPTARRPAQLHGRR